MNLKFKFRRQKKEVIEQGVENKEKSSIKKILCGTDISDGCFITGLVLFGIGLGQIYLPLAFLFYGAFLILLSFRV